MTSPGCLISKVLREKSIKERYLERHREKQIARFPILVSILTVKEIFTAGLVFELGNSETVSFWRDKWLEEGRLKEHCLRGVKRHRMVQ